jgi:hypothetical protein
MFGEKLSSALSYFREYYNRIDGVVVFLLAILVILLVCVAFIRWPPVYPLLVAFACALSGSLLGFLFAVPKRIRQAGIVPVAAGSAGGLAAAPNSPDSGTAGGGATAATYESNTSLEEISDWLTKIIVGVGLVEAKQIADALGHAGRTVGEGIYGQTAGSAAGEALGVATIVAFAVIGFLASFLWFRQNLLPAWTQADATRFVSERRLNEAPPQRVQSPTPAPSPGDMPAEPPAAANVVAADGPATLADRIREKYALLRTKPKHPDDWVKDMFGGSATRRNPSRSLSAEVRPVKGENDYFEVALSVASHPPAAGEVAFFLHNTFPETTQLASVDSKGTASLTIYAYGAFTVGVLMDDGGTELELDLSQLPGAPTDFKDE